MLKSDLVETDKHSIKILLRRKNLRFLRRTNHYTNTLCVIGKQNLEYENLITNNIFTQPKIDKIKWD